MKLKDGVTLAGIDIRMRIALIAAEKIWQKLGQELVVTSARDGEHSAGSLHYYGLALDFRTRDFTAQSARTAQETLSDALGISFDVVMATDHIHVEYDP